MERTRKWVSTAAGAVLLLAGATTARAVVVKALSPGHTAYGISQYLVNNEGLEEGNSSIKMMNPTHFPMAAGILVYNRERPDGQGKPGIWFGCAVKVLESHGADSVDSDVDPFDLVGTNTGTDANTSGWYTEIIAAPTAKVKVGSSSKRIADGLGINADRSSGDEQGSSHYVRMHPSLFTLPANNLRAAQKEAAHDCLCNELASNGLPSDTFAEFGVACH